MQCILIILSVPEKGQPRGITYFLWFYWSINCLVSKRKIFYYITTENAFNFKNALKMCDEESEKGVGGLCRLG
jgi:hypothetical protein